jgi:hypothetical protein
MTEILTTYTVKGRNFPSVWLFKYDLNGFLKEWIIEEEELTIKQIQWLFHPARFPYLEKDMISHFMTINNLEVVKGEPDLTFDTFYKAYDVKLGKLEAQRAWKKTSKADKIKALQKIKAYNGYLKRSKKEKVYPATYLNKRRFDDEFNSL